jgi:CBS domain-containing protein/ribosome-associated translation inhibitor RaiA
MNLVDILEKPLVFSPEEMISHVTSVMFRDKKQDALIIESGVFLGIITAKDIVKKSIPNPDKTKIASFLKKIDPIDIDTSVEDVINLMLINDYKILPVQKGDDVFVINKLDLLKLIKNEAFSDKKVSDVMEFPYCVSSYDSLATARSVLKDLNISVLPVIDKNGKIEGLVDPLDLLHTIVSKQRMHLGEVTGEKLSLDKMPISSFMTTDVVKISSNEPLKNAVKTMLEKSAHAILVEDKGKVAGMITPKNILKLISSPVKGVYVNVSGLGKEDEFLTSIVNEEIENRLNKLEKIIPIKYLAMHYDKHEKGGERIKYSVKARLITEKGSFFAQDFAWDLTKTTKEVLRKLEREVTKGVEKHRRIEEIFREK